VILLFQRSPPPAKLATGEILTSFQGKYPFAQRKGVVPASDGAGEVVAVGPKVSRFQKGDRVATLFNQGHLSGSLNPQSATTGVGGAIDGALRQYGVYSEEGLVEIPQSLNWLEGSTLSCAALTAWNALYGLKPLAPGDTVLTQGTGGVSIFALQFAKAAGATVIATTSSAAKAETLKKLGADHVLNYKENPNWGEEAKKLSSKGEGVDQIVEVGGPATMAQSLKAIKIDGIISIIGYVQSIGPKKTDLANMSTDSLPVTQRSSHHSSMPSSTSALSAVSSSVAVPNSSR
jgi:NADPH:quinone reductase-like Zn-dependent oxidoreductase